MMRAEALQAAGETRGKPRRAAFKPECPEVWQSLVDGVSTLWTLALLFSDREPGLVGIVKLFSCSLSLSRDWQDC